MLKSYYYYDEINDTIFLNEDFVPIDLIKEEYIES